MTKKILVMLLTLCLAITAMTVMACAEIASGDEWVLDDDGTLRFTGTSGLGYWAETDHTAYCEKVTSVVFYDGTDRIPDDAFKGCKNLASITIPDTVTEIGNNAFYGCSSLTTVTIPSSVETIGSLVFSGCSGLQSLVIENCGLEVDAGTISVDEHKITQAAHTYSGGVCTVCGADDPNYVAPASITISSETILDGQYVLTGFDPSFGSTIYTGDPTSGSGYAYYKDGVLYLDNFTHEGNQIGIYSSGDLTIELSGTNSITSNNSAGILAGGSLTISGSDGTTSSITVSGNNDGIYSGAGNVSISDCTVSTSRIVSNGTVIIEDSTIEVTGEFYSASSVIISGDVDITANSGITLYSGSITVEPTPGETLEVTVGSSTYYYSTKTTINGSSEAITVKTHTHSYGSPVWAWGSGYSSATEVSTSTVAAGCTTDGSTTYTAKVTFNGTDYTGTKTETIAATGHTVVTDLAVEPTCTETGLTAGSHCSVCNTVIVAQEVVEATGHDYEISYFTWADGYKSATATFACANCNDEQTVDATVSVENYYGMYVYVATARYGASGATYSSVKTVGTVDMSGFETNSTEEVITEEVETEEPVEGTDTETEVDEEAEAETNPTTGIVVAMMPMALAAVAAAVAKRKL